MLTRRTLLQTVAAAGSVAALEGLFPSTAQANALRVGTMAPTASFVTLEGERVSTSSLVGQVVLLTFWATWCVPCREELPLLSRYQDEHRDAGLKILGISLDPPDDLVEVRRVARSLSFPVGLMATASAPGYGRIWRLPVSFVIDRGGVLVNDGWKEKQPSFTRQRLDEVVGPLLARVTGANS